MLELAPGWLVEMERGPECLFVRLRRAEEVAADETDLGDRLWSLLQQHNIYRLILELDDLPVLQSRLISQLVALRSRIDLHRGLMRLCGLSEMGRQALKKCRLDARLPDYRDRNEAIMGFRPSKPK